MSDSLRIQRTLTRECSVFTRYLIRVSPTEYVEEKYRDYHRQSPGLAAPVRAFDRLLLVVARVAVCGTCVADAYSSCFCKSSPLRAKLVLTLALLECTPPTYQVIDSPYRGRSLWIIIRLLADGMMFFTALVTGAVLLGPVHFVMSGFDILKKKKR